MNDLLVYNEILCSERNNRPLAPSIESKKQQVKQRVEQWGVAFQKLHSFEQGKFLGTIIGGLKAHRIVPKTIHFSRNFIEYGRVRQPPQFRLLQNGDPNLGYVPSLNLDEIRKTMGFQKYIFVKGRVGNRRFFKINLDNRNGHPQLAMLPNGQTPLIELAGEAFCENGALQSFTGTLNNMAGRAMTSGDHLPSMTVHAFKKFGMTEANVHLFENFASRIPFNASRGCIPGLNFHQIDGNPGRYSYILSRNGNQYSLKIGPKSERWRMQEREVSLRELAVDQNGHFPEGNFAAGDLVVEKNVVNSVTNIIRSQNASGWDIDLSDPILKELKKFGFKEVPVFVENPSTTISELRFKGNPPVFPDQPKSTPLLPNIHQSKPDQMEPIQEDTEENFSISPPKKELRDEIDSLEDSPSTDQLDQLSKALLKHIETQRKKEKRTERKIKALRVAEAVANGISQWMQDRTASRVAKHHEKMAQENKNHQQHLQQRKKEWIDQQTHRLSISRWMNQEATQTLEGFHKCLNDIKKNEEKLKSLLSTSSNEQGSDHSQEIKNVRKKISKRKKIARKFLKGAEKTLAFGSAILTPINPVVGGALAVGAAGCNGIGSYIDHKIAKKEIEQDQKNALAQNEKEMQSIQDAQAEHELALSRQERLVLLDSVIAAEESIPPWVRREALEARVKYWDEEMNALTDPKQTEKNIISEQYLENIKAAKEKDEQVLADEKKYSQISDRSWRVADYWKNVWSSSDKEALQFANKLQEAVHSYKKATKKERKTILYTLRSFEALAAITGHPSLERYAQMGQNGYVIFDLCRYFTSTAFPNLKDAWNGPKSMRENLGGWLTICKDYLGPAASLAIVSIQLYKLSQSTDEYVPTPDELRYHALCHRLNDLESSLSEMIAMNSFDLREQIQICRSAVEEAKKEIVETIHLEFGRARLDDEEKAYENQTEKLKKSLLQLEQKIDRYGMGSNPSKKLLPFLHAEVMQLDTDVQNGLIAPIRGDSFSIPSYSRLVFQNPDLYSGLIASLLDGKIQLLPNLRRYFVLVRGYQSIKDPVNQNDQKKLVEEIRIALLESGEKLQSFFDSWSAMCKRTATAHNNILSIAQEKTQKSKALSDNVLEERIKKSSEHLDRLTLTGGSRFGLSNAFVNTRKPRLSFPDVSENVEKRFSTTKIAATDTSITMTAFGVLFGTLGFFIGGPAGAVGCAAYAGLGTSAFAIKDATNYGAIQRRNYIYSLIKDVESKSQGENTREKYKEPEGTMIIQVSSARRVHDLIISKVTVMDLWGVSVYQNQNPSSPLFKLHEQGISVDSSLITTEELDELPIIDWEDKFLTQESMKIVKDLQNQKSHVVIPPSDPNLIPLSFPQKVIAIMNQETARLNALGYELHPEYSFAYRAAHQDYALSLSWKVAEGKIFHGNRAKILLATFDENSVRSFGAPIIQNGQIEQEPANVNEFLLHAVYGSMLGSEIGLPGEKTTAIRRGKVIAPADLPFPGLFTLLDRSFAEVHFRSQQYNGKESSLFLNGSKLTIEWNKMGTPNCSDLEEAYKDYCQTHAGLKGMFTMLFGVDPNISDFHLQSAGLEIPARGIVRELYQEMHTYHESQNITDSKLKQFEVSLGYSDERKKILGSIQLLK